MCGVGEDLPWHSSEDRVPLLCKLYHLWGVFPTGYASGVFRRGRAQSGSWVCSRVTS